MEDKEKDSFVEKKAEELLADLDELGKELRLFKVTNESLEEIKDKYAQVTDSIKSLVRSATTVYQRLDELNDTSIMRRLTALEQKLTIFMIATGSLILVNIILVIVDLVGK